MEATPQATQRKITLASLDLVHARRPDFQVFNELMVQYAEPGSEAIRRVVPDNMVVLHEGDLGPLTSLSLPVHAVRPFWVMEYASTSSRRKDDEDNFDKYERILEAPYYLLYYPENEELTLYRFDAERHRYDTVPPGGEGRRALPEVGIEVGLVGGWVRFWHEGRLLLLPAEADRELDEVRAERDRESRRADLEKLRGDRERRRADYWTRLADYWTQRADEAKQQADEEHRRAGQLAAKSRALGIDPDA